MTPASKWLWRNRCSEDGKHADCPKCETTRPFKKYATKQRRQSWTCTTCGHHLQPTAGTIFEGSSTSLHLWFYACHLMTSTKCGLSAKQLEREIGVTYKTAWRMLNLIRNNLMEQDGPPLSGDVEVDETGIGGKPRAGLRLTPQEAVIWARRAGPRSSGWWNVAGASRPPWPPVDRATRSRTSSTSTSCPSPSSLPMNGPGTRSSAAATPPTTIRHAERIYVSGDVHTQTVEGFFSNLKRGIAGTYHAVSRKWLQGYLNEFAWRYNNRHDREADFRLLLLRAAGA